MSPLPNAQPGEDPLVLLHAIKKHLHHVIQGLLAMSQALTNLTAEVDTLELVTQRAIDAINAGGSGGGATEQEIQHEADRIQTQTDALTAALNAQPTP